MLAALNTQKDQKTKDPDRNFRKHTYDKSICNNASYGDAS